MWFSYVINRTSLFSYQGQPPYVLNDLNLHIHSGDYISIVGDNGCGKSTLLRLILGFLTPVKGSIKRSTNNIRYVSQKMTSLTQAFLLR